MAETTVTYDRAHGTIITAKGLAEITAALANDQKLNIVQVAFGDGGGEEYIPDASQTDIKNEVYAVTPSGIYSDALTSNSLVVTALIPSDVGGWTIREAALRLPSGEAVVIATTNPFPKVAEEKGFFLKYEFVFPVSNTAAFEFRYDPNTEAVREYVRVAMLEHNDDPNAHGGIIQQAADNVANAVEQVKSTDKELRELVSEKLREIQESVTKTVVESKAAYRFNMTKSGATVRLNTETLPSSLPELAMLYGQATADYLYSDSIFINDTPVRLLTPTMYPIAKAAWSSGGGIQLLWKTAEKQLFYQMSHNSSGTGSENGDGGSGEEGGGNESGGGDEGGGNEGGGNEGGGEETPTPLADDWVNDKDYIMADLAYGSNKALYEAIAPSGPGQTVGPRDPASEPIVSGVTMDTNITTLSLSGAHPRIAYGDGKYVMIPRDSNNAAYSRDGINWIRTTLPTTATWTGVAYGGGRFVAVASGSNIAAYSDDAISWVATTLPAGVEWRDIAWGKGVFVAISVGSSAVSANGIDWSLHSVTTTGVNPYSITYGNGKFVFTGLGPGVGYSVDGKGWGFSSISNRAQSWYVASGNGIFVATGSMGRIAAYSEDAIAWNLVDTPENHITGSAHPVTFGRNLFLSLTSGGAVLYSQNGADWFAGPVLESIVYWYSMAFDGESFVAAGNAPISAVKISLTEQYLPNCWKQVG